MKRSEDEGLISELKHILSLMKEQLHNSPNSITEGEYSTVAERLETLLQKHNERLAFEKQCIERPWEVFE